MKVVVLPFLLIALIGTSQDPLLDSLKNELEAIQNKNSDKYLETLNEYAFQLGRRGNLELATQLFDKGITLSREKNDVEMLARFANDKALIYFDNDKIKESLLAYEQANAFFLEIGDSLRLARNYYDIARSATEIDNYPYAIENYQRALKIFEEIGDSLSMSSVYNSIGIVFSKQEDFAKSIEYHEKAMAIEKSANDFQGLGITMNNLGLTNKKAGNYQKAIQSYKEALVLANEIDFVDLKGVAYNNLGNLKEILGEIDSAMYFQEKAYEIATDINYRVLKGWAIKGKASVALKQGKVEEAIRLSSESYQIGVNVQQKDIVRQSSEILYKAYEQKNDFKNAFTYHKLYKLYDDSIINLESVRKTEALAYEYKYRQATELQKMELQTQEAIFSAEVGAQKRQRNWLIGGLVFTILVALFIYRNYRKNILINQALLEKNRIIGEQADTLKELNETKDKFYSIISHDLRGPMSVFMGFSMIIKTFIDQKKYEELKSFADKVHDMARNVGDLLDNLLTWALEQRNDFTFKMAQVSLQEVVQQNVSLMHPLAEPKDISIKVAIPEEAKVLADKNSLLTIIRNLLNNSIKFTEAGGSIELSAEMNKDYTLLHVKDTGIGIEQEKIDTLFSMNEKKIMRGTGGEKGVGLGLQLVLDFVERNDGKVYVESKVGEGTTFTVSLKNA
jgi:signal transduction histidine kinase